MAENGRIEEEFGIVARNHIEAIAALDPVVAFIAEQEVAAFAAEHEIVAFAAEHFLAVRTGNEDIGPLVAEDECQARAAVNDVVSFLTHEEVGFADVGAGIGDDIVALATMDLVDAVTGFDPVIAATAPDGVVAATGDDRVVAVRSLDEDMVETIVLDEVGPAFDERSKGILERILAHWIGVAPLGLFGAVDIQDMVRDGEDVARYGIACLTDIGVANDHFGEGIGFQLVEQVQALGTRQIIETVAILQVFKLQFEDEGEGGAQHAAEGHLLFGQTANPEIDVV